MHTLVCSVCGDAYPEHYRNWRCRCGGRLSLEGDFTPSPAMIRPGEHSIWRYAAVLPVADDHRFSLGEGWTPLLNYSDRKAGVYLKLDHLFPSGSYKDRGAAVLLSQASRLGITHIVEDSSGNAGAAIAMYAAAAGIAADIYVPAANSPGKLAQIRAAGATLVPVEGSRSDTAAAALQAAERSYYASHVWNPYFIEGTKTFAYELWEQLDFTAPDAVVLPAGNGTLLLGSFRGFSELYRAGQIDAVPKHIAVQSALCAPLARHLRSASPHSGDADGGGCGGAGLAEGIAIAAPPLLKEMLQLLTASGGAVITVEEAEIRAALVKAVRRGIYIEPTAAAALAGLERYVQEAAEGERIVGAVTGHGLKAPEKIATLTAEEDRTPHEGGGTHAGKG